MSKYIVSFYWDNLRYREYMVSYDFRRKVGTISKNKNKSQHYPLILCRKIIEQQIGGKMNRFKINVIHNII